MIVDRIENLGRYALPRAGEIVAYLKSVDPVTLPVGEVEISGRELFVRPSEYETRAPQDGKFETHSCYADLQYVAKGAEVMQTALSDGLVSVGEYDEKADIQFFRTDTGISDIVVPVGYFTVFFPGEAHRPCCQLDGKPGQVKKLVFKIRIKQD